MRARSRPTRPGLSSSSSPHRPPQRSSGSTDWSPPDRPREKSPMKHRVSTLALALAATASHAQPTDLNETQRLGRQVFAQSCGICHLQPSLGVKTYGPVLNKTATSGNDEVMRAFIVNGTDRMPAFKYYLKPAEIDAIIAYVRTVPVPNEPQK